MGRGGKGRRRTQRRFQDRPGGDHYFLQGNAGRRQNAENGRGLGPLAAQRDGKVLKRQIRDQFWLGRRRAV